MILIPETETVVILVPRTGSGSLRRALLDAYPKAMQIYRHMEADGVPASYDRWRKVGVIREPIQRLWSLYKFCRQGGNSQTAHPRQILYPAHIASQRRAADMSFEQWVVSNEVPFTNAYSDGEKFYPAYAVNHSMPENRKSQFLYLRPDLGTEVWPFENYAEFCNALGVNPGRVNDTEPTACPGLGPDGMAHMERFFAWDFAFHKELIRSRMAA